MLVVTEAVALPRTRFLIVVRRGDEATYRYLKERMATLQDVEIVLDRREASNGKTSGDRRQSRAGFNVFGVLLVKR